MHVICRNQKPLGRLCLHLLRSPSLHPLNLVPREHDGAVKWLVPERLTRRVEHYELSIDVAQISVESVQYKQNPMGLFRWFRSCEKAVAERRRYGRFQRLVCSVLLDKWLHPRHYALRKTGHYAQTRMKFLIRGEDAGNLLADLDQMIYPLMKTR